MLKTASTKVPPGVKVETKLPEVKAVFTKPGSVGMELKEDTGPQGTRAVSIVSLVAGTQADTHAELRPGLKVVAVAGQDVKFMQSAIT